MFYDLRQPLVVNADTMLTPRSRGEDRRSLIHIQYMKRQNEKLKTDECSYPRQTGQITPNNPESKTDFYSSVQETP